jgi:hypothetical protein
MEVKAPLNFFICVLAVVFSSVVSPLNAQTSVRDWPMPAGYSNGLTKPGFKVVPTFSFLNLGSEKHLILKMDVQMGTARNPVGPFSFRYTFSGKEYTDQDLGFDPFTSIRMQQAEFDVLVQGPNMSKRIIYQSGISQEDLGIVPKEAVLSTYRCHIENLKNITYSGTETIETAIRGYEANRNKKTEIKSTPVVPKVSNNTPYTTAPEKKTESPGIKTTTNTVTNKTATTQSNNQSQNQSNLKNLPDLLRTTDGGYFQRGADGKFKRVTEDEYYKAKTTAAAAKNTPAAPEEPKMTPAEVKNAVDKMFTDARDRDAAIDARFKQVSQAIQQNFYYSEAVRNGKKNLSELSTLSGDYSSIEQLEAEFKQKYNSIHGEVQALEQTRNAQLNNAVNANFNGSSTEQAVGQGVALIGGLINSAKANKEEKEARAALLRERAREKEALIAAKKKARTEMRNQLLKSFPGGGTPLTAHKINLPEVYMFSYMIEPASMINEKADVSVSNVFPVAQYSDGTYPLKTVVSGRLKGMAKGDVMLVGFYSDKNSAEQMRNSFMTLAQKSELTVKQVTLKTTNSNSSGTSTVSGNFWETGKKQTPASDTTKKKSDFWNN